MGMDEMQGYAGKMQARFDRASEPARRMREYADKMQARFDHANERGRRMQEWADRLANGFRLSIPVVLGRKI